MTGNLPAIVEDEGRLGPAMAALTQRQRAFVLALFDQKPGKGAYAAAARQAGYGNENTTPKTDQSTANRLLNDDGVIAAIEEVTRQRIRSLGPASVIGLQNLVNDPTHKDHGRALGMIVDRIFPQITKQEVSVTHEIIDHDAALVQHYRRLVRLGVSREKMIEDLGGQPSALTRAERLAAAEDAKNTKIIEAQYTEVPATTVAIDDFMTPLPLKGGTDGR